MKIPMLTSVAIFTVNVALAQCPVPPANTPSADVNQLAISRLGQFLKCDATDPLNDQSPCNTFASRGLESIYGVNDFKTGPSTHQSANQMWDATNSSGSKWIKLGGIFDEQNNLCAQSMANTGWPVIALLKGTSHGHVAMIIPGEPKKSESWGILAANSASFFLNKPASAYLNKPLSSAFDATSAQKASFFYRKLGALTTLSATVVAWRVPLGPIGEAKGDDPRIDPPKIDLPKIPPLKIDPPKIDLPKLPDPTKKEFWEKPANYILPGAQLVPGVSEATTQIVEQVGNTVIATAKTVANDTVKTLVNAHGDVITTIEKAGSDTVRTFEKIGKNATATYLKAWKDTAEQARRNLNDVAEAAAAIKRYQERDLEAKVRAANNAIRRANEGKFLDAAWHIGTEQMQATEENYFKATQESTLINAAGQAAATAYGGPGGAAAYTAWYTYRTTGDPEMAIRAGILSAVTSQGGSTVSSLPSGTAIEAIKKAAVAGAVGGLAVAAAGGDEKAITEAFLRSGGAVLVQSGTDNFKMHNPKAADAFQTVHCLSTRDVDCLSNTTYVKDAKGKILYDANGKPRIEKYIPQGVAKWTRSDPNSPDAKQVAFITKVAKLAESGELPVFGGKWVITTNLGARDQLEQNEPSVVLTYAGAEPPFDFQNDYEYKEQVAGYICKLGTSVRRVNVTRKDNACQALYFRDGKTQIIFSSPNHPTKCLAATREFLEGRMKEIGASCTQPESGPTPNMYKR